ncbi:hypothetical protein [Microvirga sp. G4-2]|uniref:hypothetical protein n=1 Tax=Microvirga sp. G4-2 TaxID=3434467 RepID=UPI00404418A6
MNATTISELQAIAQEARAQEAAAGKLATRIEKLLQTAQTAAKSAGSSAPDLFKRADGRLTDAGIAAVNAAFDAGATVTEVAKKFGIHVSASSNRRKIWLAGKSGAAA